MPTSFCVSSTFDTNKVDKASQVHSFLSLLSHTITDKHLPFYHLMFKPPRKTLQKSLDTLLNNAQEYVADVYFDYPEGKLWAHRGTFKEETRRKGSFY